MARILIVDDDEHMRKLLARLLERNGYHCTLAADAAEGRKRLAEAEFELVLSDIRMPGESGLDFIRYVLVAHPDTAAMIVSGMDDPSAVENAVEMGIYGYIIKPFAVNGVLISVANALHRRRLEIENRAHQENLERMVQQRTAVLQETIQQLERTQKELSENEEKYRMLVKNLPSIVYKGDQNWTIGFIDGKIKELTGYDRSLFNAQRMKWSDIILKEDLQGVKRLFAKALESDGSFVREYRIKTLDGRILWIQDRGQIIRRENGDIDHINGVIFDITEHKAAEATIIHTKEEWERTFDAVPDLIAIIDDRFRIKRVNRAMADRLGMKPHEALGLHCYECVHELGTPLSDCPHTRLLKDGREHVVEVAEGRLGGNFIVSTSPLYDPDGHLAGSVHVARDITERKRAEEELRRTHTEMKLLLDSISSILISIDSEGRINRWNRVAQTTFGLHEKDVVGRSLRECCIASDLASILEQIDASRAEAAVKRLEDVRFTRQDGKLGFLGITLNPVFTTGGDPAGMLIMGADITERRILESQLSQAQKLESIGQLAAGIAHEINTPTQYVGDNIRFLQEAAGDLQNLLNQYSDLLEAIKQQNPWAEIVETIDATSQEIDLEYLQEEIPKAIAQSLEGVDRVAKIVLAMKDFSHPGNEEKSLIDINKAVESTITVARNEWKYVSEMHTDLDPTLPPVPCFPGELNQVFLNIIINAAHAISDVMSKQPDQKGNIRVSTIRNNCKNDEWCEIRISDSGTGIPEKVRPRIFDPFFTTKEVGRGTGQGLAISHSVIVEKHGGTLSFETEMGKGTTFIIRLPLDHDTASERIQ